MSIGVDWCARVVLNDRTVQLIAVPCGSVHCGGASEPTDGAGGGAAAARA